jgi:S1 RNA binding domain protein
MAIVVGEIHKGEVTGITNFGAFIKLANGKTGVCHISEVSSDYVKDVKNHLKVGEEVKVKVIKVDGDKLSLSIKALEEKKSQPEVIEKKESKPRNKNFEKMLSNFMDNSVDSSKPSSSSKGRGSSYDKRK